MLDQIFSLSEIVVWGMEEWLSQYEPEARTALAAVQGYTWTTLCLQDYQYPITFDLHTNANAALLGPLFQNANSQRSPMPKKTKVWCRRLERCCKEEWVFRKILSLFILTTQTKFQSKQNDKHINKGYPDFTSVWAAIYVFKWQFYRNVDLDLISEATLRQ